MLSLLALLAQSAVFGFDYGSEFIKVSMALPGKAVHVALNEQSRRLSPSFFAIWNISNPSSTQIPGHWNKTTLRSCSWAFNDQARSHFMRFPQNAVKGLSPMLGNALGFSRREIFALMLRHLITSVDAQQWLPETASVVIVVEPWLPRSARLAIAEAVSMSNATLSSIIDAPTAAAYAYALEKHALYAEKPRTVIFVDLGSTTTWAAAFRFTNAKPSAKVEELAIASNFSLGGNQIDSKLAQRLQSVFYEKTKAKPTSERSRIRFLDEARKAKEALSLDKEITIRMDDVVDDLGFSYVLTRDEFDSLISDVGVSLQNLMNEVTERAKLNISEIDSIELLGGSTRVPFIQNALLEVSGMEKLNRTMNSDEAIALGAAYVGAAQSSSFIVKRIDINPFCNCEITAKVNGTKIGVFNSSSFLSQTFNLSINNANVSLFEGDTEIGSYEIGNESMVSFDSFTLPVIKGAKRFFAPTFSMTPENLKSSSETILAMDSITRHRRKLISTKNEYESLIYRIKEQLDFNDIFKRVTSKKEKEELINLTDEHQKWFDESNGNDTKAFRKKTEELRAKIAPFEERAEELPKRLPAFNELNRTLRVVFIALNKTLPREKPWIPKERLDSLWSIFNNTEQWMLEKWKLQSQLNESCDPAVKSYEIERRKRSLELSYDAVERIPKPTPIPTPLPTVVLNISQVNATETNMSALNNSLLNQTAMNNSSLLNQTTVNNSSPANHTKESNATGGGEL